MLECYLDDSGKDPQNPVTTIAGYLAHESGWKAFETEVEAIFQRRKVRVLHAKELESTRGDFKGWKVLQKQAFVAQICQVMSRHVGLGLTMSAVKAPYKALAAKTPRKQQMTAYTFCFNVIIDWILKDVQFGRVVQNDGIAFFLECGHENNGEAENQFYEVRKLFGLANVLRSISFVPKEHCRAIQVADLLAFYSRRDQVAFEKALKDGKDHKEGTMIKLITGSLRHHGYVATDFVPDRPDRAAFAASIKAKSS